VLIRILPDQVSHHWNIISYAIKNSLPSFVPVDEDYMNNVLTALLAENLDCWVSVNNQKEIEAVATTQILTDFATNTKALLIYTTFGYSKIEDGSWVEAFKTVSEFARNSGCKKICCYTTNDFIISQAMKFGGQAETFITFNV
jgi:hypothetical protein